MKKFTSKILRGIAILITNLIGVLIIKSNKDDMLIIIYLLSITLMMFGFSLFLEWISYKNQGSDTDNVNIKFTKNDRLKITNFDHIYSSRESRTSFVL